MSKAPSPPSSQPTPAPGKPKQPTWQCVRWVAEEDHSTETTALLARIHADTIALLVRSTNVTLEQYVDELLQLEKKARFGGDTLSTQRLATEVVKIYRVLQKYDAMFDAVEELMKKRGQMKQVQSAMVAESAKVIRDEDSSSGLTRDQRLAFLKRLKFLTEGKIHVDLDHARFTVELARLLEEDGGALREASDMLYAIQVETVTTMPRLEKITNIVKQLQVSLDLRDSTRAVMLSRKLNPRALAKDDTRAQKIEYFWLMAEHFERQVDTMPAAYMAIAKCWMEIYRTIPASFSEGATAAYVRPTDHASVFSSAAKSSFIFEAKAQSNYPRSQSHALSMAVAALLITPHCSAKDIDDCGECVAFEKELQKKTDRPAWMAELAELKDVATDHATLQRVLHAFGSHDLIRTSPSMLADVETLLAEHPFLVGVESRSTALMSRLSEHDIFTVSGYYTRVGLSRLAALVGLTKEQTEAFLLSLVTTKTIYAKIDRVDDVVVFEHVQNPVDIAEAWNERVDHAAALVDRVCHLVAKERMIVSSALNAAASAAASIAATATSSNSAAAAA